MSFIGHVFLISTLYYYNVINSELLLQVAALATLALLLAATGGSDMSLQYIFIIYVHVCMHQSEVYEVWIVRVVEVWEQQCTTFTLLSTSMPSFQPLVQ